MARPEINVYVLVREYNIVRFELLLRGFCFTGSTFIFYIPE